MKSLIAIIRALIFLFLLAAISVSAQKGSFICGTNWTDTRDNQVYKTVMIGTQCWFAQNLNVGTRISGASNQTNNGTIEKYCYNDNVSNCNTYGGLYQWNEMMQYKSNLPIQGICPTGWHLPTDDEWTTLSDKVGGSVSAGFFLKEAGTAHWDSPNSADDEYGFTALPGGRYMTNDSYMELGATGYFWTSSLYDLTNSLCRELSNDNTLMGSPYMPEVLGLSVRCLADKGTVNINENKKLNNLLEISPNPANSFIVVSCQLTGNSPVNISIYDIAGKLVFTENTLPGKTGINISDLNDGVYLLKITGKDFNATEKFVMKH
jgi:uncharacterized protein (TIGR02145 family)